MENNNQLKELVREKYSAIASQDKEINQASCCGATSCGPDNIYSIMADDYSRLEGYNPDADLGLGCGIPTQFARIREGDTVIDLGSGAGNDAFVARRQAGATGRIIGIDFSDAMIEKARANVEKLGFNNMEFRHGDIEKMPLSSNMANVVISNCVLNLVPDKQKVYSEIYRVLKQGGHFAISDIVLDGTLPDRLRSAAEMYAGCVSGAIQKDEYLSIIHKAGFEEVSVLSEKKITIPEEILLEYISPGELEAFKQGAGIFSITVFGRKPICDPGSGCC